MRAMCDEAIGPRSVQCESGTCSVNLPEDRPDREQGRIPLLLRSEGEGVLDRPVREGDRLQFTALDLQRRFLQVAAEFLGIDVVMAVCRHGGAPVLQFMGCSMAGAVLRRCG